MEVIHGNQLMVDTSYWVGETPVLLCRAFSVASHNIKKPCRTCIFPRERCIMIEQVSKERLEAVQEQRIFVDHPRMVLSPLLGPGAVSQVLKHLP